MLGGFLKESFNLDSPILKISGCISTQLIEPASTWRSCVLTNVVGRYNDSDPSLYIGLLCRSARISITIVPRCPGKAYYLETSLRNSTISYGPAFPNRY